MNPSSPPVLRSTPASVALALPDWVRRVLICNPFYLVSAALLLFGVGQLSVDPNFLGDERPKLLFNFTALQLYGLLLAVTAIWLRQRKIWYDASLLVVVDQGLALVPFILLSQAALMSEGLGWTLTWGGAALALGRATAIRRGFPEFNLPLRALALGFVVLVLNVALPFAFRTVVQRGAIADWEVPNRWLWWVGLPLLVAGANGLPVPRHGGSLAPQRPWLPLLIYGLWSVGSGVHLWCVAYLGKFALTAPLLAPVVTVAVWTLWHRIGDCVGAAVYPWRPKLLVAAALAPFLGWQDPAVVFAVGLPGLVGLFALGFWGPVYLRTVARRLALATSVGMSLLLPDEWLGALGFTPAGIALACGGVLLIWAAWRTRLPALGILSGAAIGLALTGWHPTHEGHWGAQVGFVWVLLHSLLWDDDQHEGARGVRVLVSVLWVVHGLIWTHEATLGIAAASGGLGLLVGLAWIGANRVRGEWGLWTLGAAAGVNCLGGPTQWLLAQTTTGLLALAASLGCFAIGTTYAWMRTSDWLAKVRGALGLSPCSSPASTITKAERKTAE